MLIARALLYRAAAQYVSFRLPAEHAEDDFFCFFLFFFRGMGSFGFDNRRLVCIGV